MHDDIKGIRPEGPGEYFKYLKSRWQRPSGLWFWFKPSPKSAALLAGK
jgi:hypothetical protein